jgi:hypothetical protein
MGALKDAPCFAIQVKRAMPVAPGFFAAPEPTIVLQFDRRAPGRVLILSAGLAEITKDVQIPADDHFS